MENKKDCPDTARVYERAKPEAESGMGRLDDPTKGATPTDRPDHLDGPDHSMHEEQPMGEDQMPTDIHDPRQKRHPRKEGRGGTP